MQDNKERIFTDSYTQDLARALLYSGSIILVMWLLSVFVIK